MRDFQANDRVIGSELRSALVDAPERSTYVVSDTTPTSPTDLEVGCDAGEVVVDGSEVSVGAQTEAVSDISGQVTETAYRYHTLSVDATGTLVVRSSPVGEFDADDPDAEPITQVTEPAHETGEVFIGTAFQVGAAVERVFDGRYVLDGVPNSVITQGEGSGLDADTTQGKIPAISHTFCSFETVFTTLEAETEAEGFSRLNIPSSLISGYNTVEISANLQAGGGNTTTLKLYGDSTEILSTSVTDDGRVTESAQNIAADQYRITIGTTSSQDTGVIYNCSAVWR